ncbi:MAG: tape measure protein [Halopseudomonas sp.]|uniref:tape measure protein n=1 Tax=Halopseudomonas sp. TaxID=2901191 RepID=UPI0030013239
MAGIKDRLIQFILRGKNDLSAPADEAAASLDAVKKSGKGLRDELEKAKTAQGLALALSNTTSQAERVRVTLERTEKRAAELRDELSASPGSKGLEVALQAAEKEAAGAARQLDKLTADLRDVEKAAKDAGVDTDNLADEERRLALEVDKAKRAVSDNTTELRQLERQQRAAAKAAEEHRGRVDSVRSAMSSGAKQVLAFAAAYISLNAAFGVVQRGLNLVRDGIYSMLATGDQFEGMQTQLTALMGSIEGGEKATEWIKQFTRDTPLQLEDVTQAFTLLKAFGLDPMDGTLQAITDQSEKLGGGMEKLTGISSALGKAWAKQKLQGEEILQLVERGVPVWDLLEKVTGKNTEQLQKLSSAGKLGRDVISDLIKEIGNAAEGSAAANMTRLTGIVSNLKDVAVDFMNRIAKSGAMEYVKDQLRAVADTLDEMDKDGRLDKLAQSLSTAFVQGAEKVREFITELVRIDFKSLTDDSTGFLNNFGAAIDDAALRVKLFIAPFRTFFNGLTSAFAVVGAAGAKFAERQLSFFQRIADAIPAMLGGDKIRAKLDETQAGLQAMSAAMLAQVEQDGQDIRNAWDTNADHAVRAEQKAQSERVEVAKAATDQQRMMNQALVDEMIIGHQVVKNAAIEAANTGVKAIASFAEAQKLIDTASTVAQLEGLRTAMRRAYQEGAITQQEYAAGLGIVADKLEAIGGESANTAKSLSDVIAELEDFAGVQKAIGNAKTDVDISKLRSAITKLYEDGKLTVDEYTKAVADLDKQQAKLTQSTGDQADAQSNLEKQLQRVSDALATQAEAEAAAAAAREEQQAVFRDAFSTFFDDVMTAARSPLAELSSKALEAFDSLKGISSVDIDLDTSSLEGTAASLALVNEKVGELQAGLDDQFRGPFARWADETLFASRQLQKRFLEQTAALQTLMQGYDAGTQTLVDFTREAKQARQDLDLLEDAELQQLDAAIASASQRMQELGNNSRTTLDGLRDELDRLQGNTEAIEKRRLESRQRELQAQMAEARAAGNDEALRNLGEAMSVLQAINNETRRAQREQPAAAAPPGGTAPAAQQSAQPSRVIRLESARGSAVDVAVGEGQEDALLGILEQAGLRTV